MNAVYDAIVTLGFPELRRRRWRTRRLASRRRRVDPRGTRARRRRNPRTRVHPRSRRARDDDALALAPERRPRVRGWAVSRLLAARAALPPDGVRDALVPLLAASFDARRRRRRRRRSASSIVRASSRPSRVGARRASASGREREGVSRGGRTRGKDTAEVLGFRDATDAARASATLHAANAFAMETRGEFVVAPSAFYSAALSDSLNLRAVHGVDSGRARGRADARAGGRRGGAVETRATSRATRATRATRAKRRRRDSRGRRISFVAFVFRRRVRFRRTFVPGRWIRSVGSPSRSLPRRRVASYRARRICRSATRCAPATRARRAPGGSRTTRRSEARTRRSWRSWWIANDSGGCARRPFHASLRGREKATPRAFRLGRRRGGGHRRGRRHERIFQLLVREMFGVDDEDAERRERVRRRRRRRERRGVFDVDDEDANAASVDAVENKSKSRMFAYDEESRVHWFDPAAPTTTPAPRQRFRLGARYARPPYTTGVVLDVALPLRVSPFGGRTTRADAGRSPRTLPSLARGLDQLLAHEGPGSVEEVFVADSPPDAARRQRLGGGGGTGAPGGRSRTRARGAHIPVTASNREEFVRRFAVHALVGAVAAPLDAFVREVSTGVRGPRAGSLHRRGARAPDTGRTELDVAALRRVTRYDGGSPRRIPRCWRSGASWRAMDTEERRRLLFFTTVRPRGGGFGKPALRRAAKRAGHVTAHRAHVLQRAAPAGVRQQRETERKTEVALANARGFGLQ